MGERVGSLGQPIGPLGRWLDRRRRARLSQQAPVLDDEPAFGYGAHGRPLWERGHYDGEQIRQVLRRAGFVEHNDDHDGWYANASPSTPFLVSCTAEVDEGPVELLGGYMVALRDAG